MSANAEPPVIIVGGSLTVELGPTDFPNGPRTVSANVRVTRIEVEDENGQKQTIDVPTGKFKITLFKG